VTGRQQFAVVSAVLVFAAAALAAGRFFLHDELSPPGTAGSDAPDFHVVTLDVPPKSRALANYKGQVVLLNTWATWCAPCREEMPSIERLYTTYAGKGLKVVAVSIDDAGSEQGIRDFARAFGLTFEILHDPTGSMQRTYHILGVPETFVIGKDGVIRKKISGPTDWNSAANRALVEQLLAE